MGKQQHNVLAHASSDMGQAGFDPPDWINVNKFLSNQTKYNENSSFHYPNFIDNLQNYSIIRNFKKFVCGSLAKKIYICFDLHAQRVGKPAKVDRHFYACYLHTIRRFHTPVLKHNATTALCGEDQRER